MADPVPLGWGDELITEQQAAYPCLNPWHAFIFIWNDGGVVRLPTAPLRRYPELSLTVCHLLRSSRWRGLNHVSYSCLHRSLAAINGENINVICWIWLSNVHNCAPIYKCLSTWFHTQSFYGKPYIPLVFSEHHIQKSLILLAFWG